MKKIKLLLTSLTLFLLSGCTYTHHTDLLDFSGRIDEAMTLSGLKLVEGLNSLNAAFVKLAFSLVDGTTSISAIARKTLNGFGSISGIVNFAIILSIATITVNFAKSIFKNNFSTVDRITAPSAIQLFKKLFVAILFTFMVPYLCIGSFVMSTYAGENLASIISKDEEVKVGDIWDIYDDMKNDGVSFSTYCEAGQKEAGVNKLSDLNGERSGGVYELLTEDNSLYEKYCNYGSGSSGIGMNEFINYKAKNVFESMKYSALYSPTIAYGGYNTPLEIFGLLISSPIATLLRVVYGITLLIIWLGCIIATTRRAIDLIILIGSSWWYIGSSISDEEGKTAISDLCKKLLKICISQFLLSLELVLFIQTSLSKGVELYQIFQVIAWCTVLLSTPTAVEEMVGSTGTVDSFKGVGKGMFNFLTGGK